MKVLRPAHWLQRWGSLWSHHQAKSNLTCGDTQSDLQVLQRSQATLSPPQGFRRASTRYDKLDKIFPGIITFALFIDWLRLCQQTLI